ncbi:MAG: HlyD family secretion protein [Nitrospirae bacterium]|nr:HlyD family secretion protein [Nitrospirota bacterium]
MEDVKTSSPVNNHKKKKIAVLIFSTIVIIGCIAGYFYIRYKSTHITKDDAFIEGGVYTIASKVTGTISQIYVRDNQFVKKGDLLLDLDPADYEVRVKEAEAALSAEKAKLLEIDAKIEAAKKQISELAARANAIKGLQEVQEANLQQAEADMKRAEGLYREDIIPKEKYEKTTTGYKSSLAMVKAASEGLRYSTLSVETQRSALKQAEAEKTVRLSSVKQKEALFETAKLNYGYTKIYAPADGNITKKAVKPGNQIQAGQPLMAVVDLNDIYVIANYKETQLEKVRQGQKVEIKVDTYPGKKFKGRVESIMAGTGAVFSLFPPENATGSYVKVVQRIPVKIILDKGTDSEHVLRIGMSVEPTVLVEK